MNVKDEKIHTIMVEVTFLMLEKLMVMKLIFRLASKMKDLEDGGEAAEGSDEEGGEVDCCVVCGLHRGVFKVLLNGYSPVFIEPFSRRTQEGNYTTTSAMVSTF